MENSPRTRKYEVTIFVKFEEAKPTEMAVAEYFAKYGEIERIKQVVSDTHACYFIYFSRLATQENTKRVRATLRSIVDDMSPEFKFCITIPRKKTQPKNKANDNVISNDN